MSPLEVGIFISPPQLIILSGLVVSGLVLSELVVSAIELVEGIEPAE